MPFSMNCTNKGCGQLVEPTLNTQDNEVYCTSCDRIIANVPIFTKNSLKSMGQIKRGTKSAFGVRCESCKQNSLPKMNGSDFICKLCGKKITTISKAFEPILKQKIKEAQGQ